jgi:hypothetical protein
MWAFIIIKKCFLGYNQWKNLILNTFYSFIIKIFDKYFISLKISKIDIILNTIYKFHYGIFLNYKIFIKI